MNLSILIESAHQLPAIPKVVQELIESFDDPQPDTLALAKKLANDQVLSAKVLRMANSAHYGGRRQVSTVNDAVVILGFDALRTLVLASGLTAIFTAPEGFDLKQYWRNSFNNAALSKWLASFTQLEPETAFTCGMLHNIGGLLIHILLPEQADKLDTVGREVNAQTGAAHDWDFTDLGAELASRWRFPARIVQAIRFQLRPDQAPTGAALGAEYAHLLYLSNFVLTMHSSKEPDAMLAHFPRREALALGIDVTLLLAKLPESRALNADFDLLLL